MSSSGIVVVGACPCCLSPEVRYQWSEISEGMLIGEGAMDNISECMGLRISLNQGGGKTLGRAPGKMAGKSGVTLEYLCSRFPSMRVGNSRLTNSASFFSEPNVLLRSSSIGASYKDQSHVRGMNHLIQAHVRVLTYLIKAHVGESTYASERIVMRIQARVWCSSVRNHQSCFLVLKCVKLRVRSVTYIPASVYVIY